MKRFALFLQIFIYAISNAFAQGPLNGAYVISSDASGNPDYLTIQAAINDAVSNGIENNVEFQIMPGTYVEFLTIPQIPSLGEDKRLTIKGMGQNNQEVVISGNAGYAEKPIIKLNGAGFVTIKNLKITSTSSNYANLVVFENGVNHISFDSVYFQGVDVTSNTLNNDKQLVYDNSKESYDSDLNFSNCQFINGYIALYMQGKNVITPLDRKLVIKDCFFSNQYSKSIYATFQENLFISGNTISNNKDLKDGYQGIDIYWVQDSIESSVIENNIVQIDYSAKYATGIEIRPGIGTHLSPLIIRNNQIKIKSTKDLNYGFSFSHNRGNCINLAHNSVLFEENTGGAMVFVNNNVDSINIYNNLWVNLGRGYIYRFQKVMPNRRSDYNRIFCDTSVYIGRIATNEIKTLEQWQENTDSLDIHSVMLGFNPFISNSNLHILSPDSLRVGNPLSYVVFDIDGEVRSGSNPCAGADEMEDIVNLPPYIENAISNLLFESFPDSTYLNLDSTFNDPDDPLEGIVLSVTSNSNPLLVQALFEPDNRTLFVKRLTSEEGTAIVSIQAESNGQSVEASFTVACNHEDLPPIVENPIDPVLFTQFPQEIQINIENTFSDPDSPASLMELSIQNFSATNFSAVIEGGMLILNRLRAVVFEDEPVTIRCTSEGLYVETTVLVSGEAILFEHGIATMEDVAVSSDGIWIPSSQGENTMQSNGWGFYNYYHSYYWGGFTVSNLSDGNASNAQAEFTAVPLSGINGSGNYAVAFTMGYPADVFPFDGMADSISGCYVTNNMWAYNAILEGDGLTPTPFGGASGNDPDYFRIFAVGKTIEDQNTDTLYFYLADYRFADNNQDYIVEEWEWFDLASLGVIKSVRFGLQSTKSNNWGMTTPAYFCLDDFNGERPVQVNEPPYVANPVELIVLDKFPQEVSINLQGVVTDPDDDDELIVYEISNISNSLDFEVNFSNSLLQVNRLTNENSTLTITVKATSNGQSIDFDININALSTIGIAEIAVKSRVYPNPSSRVVYVECMGLDAHNNSSVKYAIYNYLGTIVRQGIISVNGIDISELKSGQYVLKVMDTHDNVLLKELFLKY